MLYRFFLSKKGFTAVEMLIAVSVLGILTAVAVPVFKGAVEKQKLNECSNQRTVIKTAFEQVMYGMVDNGKKQETIKDANGNVIRYALNFSGKRPPHLNVKYPAVKVDDTAGIGTGDDAYVDSPCFVLCYDKQIPGKKPFTIGDIRGGYRPKTKEQDSVNGKDYYEGCAEGYYLKKKELKDKPFYEYLNSDEIPVCPFADLDDNDKSNDYYYHILWDTQTDSLKVLCSCPECNKID